MNEKPKNIKSYAENKINGNPEIQTPDILFLAMSMCSPLVAESEASAALQRRTLGDKDDIVRIERSRYSAARDWSRKVGDPLDNSARKPMQDIVKTSVNLLILLTNLLISPIIRLHSPLLYSTRD